MTEPGIGSDLASMTTTAVLDGDHYVVNGSKTFITNGINADLVITAVKTDPTQRHAGHEPARARARHGRASSAVATSRRSACTPRTPPSCSSPTSPCRSRTGSATRAAGSGRSSTKLPQERLSIAVTGVAAARQALDVTLEYVKERTAFGQPIGSFQNSRFRLAEMATEVEIAQTFVDRCVLALNDGALTAEEAAMAKWWCTELQKRVVDTCLQLHGGYGYMTRVPDRPRLRRRPHHHDLRGHHRDHEGDHRPQPRRLRRCGASTRDRNIGSGARTEGAEGTGPGRSHLQHPTSEGSRPACATPRTLRRRLLSAASARAAARPARRRRRPRAADVVKPIVFPVDGR